MNLLNQPTKKIKKELDKKVNIHRVKGDIVSAHANKENGVWKIYCNTNTQKKDADLFDKHKS